jgi:hypothetical protein
MRVITEACRVLAQILPQQVGGEGANIRRQTPGGEAFAARLLRGHQHWRSIESPSECRNCSCPINLIDAIDCDPYGAALEKPGKQPFVRESHPLA